MMWQRYSIPVLLAHVGGYTFLLLLLFLKENVISQLKIHRFFIYQVRNHLTEL